MFISDGNLSFKHLVDMSGMCVCVLVVTVYVLNVVNVCICHCDIVLINLFPFDGIAFHYSAETDELGGRGQGEERADSFIQTTQ